MKHLFIPILAIMAMLYSPSATYAADARYLFSIDARASGVPLSDVNRIFIDDERGEVYIFDNMTQRVVITDKKGGFLHSFRFREDAGLNDMPKGMVLDAKGNIYMAESAGVVILNYRGLFIERMDISALGPVDIQGIAMDKSGRLYLGDSLNKRVVIVKEKKVVSVIDSKEQGWFINTRDINVYDGGFCMVDGALSAVFCFDADGRLRVRFGMISSQSGGFSMPVGMAVDKKKARILVVDVNRLMVIAFNMDGGFQFEFGGPNVFKKPLAVNVDKEGTIYVADGGKIKVFKVIE